MSCRSLEDGKSVVITPEKAGGTGIVNNTLESLSFKVPSCHALELFSRPKERQDYDALSVNLLQFDGILEGASQDIVYTTCAQEVADSLLAGYNGTVFCYGQVTSANQLKLVPPSSNLQSSSPYAYLLAAYLLNSC